MSYQALLFCPEEKTARTVTQVLGDLDFTVTACTEPFAAVKKFMAERFDAVVVDCDNEQNATLLFKSARSAPNNQGALAVAVVEGQTGVAKAFRIGANLVLTKPINVEQAKGTLRVARGLLRKNEGGKPANAGAAPAKPVVAASVPSKPAPQTSIPSAPETRKTEPYAPAAPPVVPVQRPLVEPTVVASAGSRIGEHSTEAAVSAKSTSQSSELISSHPASPKTSVPGSTFNKIVAPTTHAEAAKYSSFAASAPAPARESMPEAPSEPANTIEPAIQDFKPHPTDHAASPDTALGAAPALTFGATSSSQKNASQGSKLMLIGAVAAVLIAVAGYAAWMKWSPAIAPGRASANLPTHATSTAPIAAAHNTENTSSPAANEANETQPPETQSLQVQKPATQKPPKVARTETHPAKESAPTDASKPDASVVAESTPPEATPAAQPMVIKSGNVKASARVTESADAPALTIPAVASAGEALPSLMPTTAATPVLQRLLVSQGVSRGLLVKQVQPVYPQTAIGMHVEGAVELMATVTKTGGISEIKVVSGDKELARAAVAAVKQWKYKPYLLNGEPVDIQTQITVKFKLPE